MKRFKWLALFLSVVMCVAMFAACTPDEPETVTYTVTYYDGSDVLKTENVEEGGKATEWTPTKDGYNFDGWYGEPTFAHTFDFTATITADTSVFAKFSSAAVVDDTREFYICGSGSSNVLGGSSVLKDGSKMTKADGKNEYTLTVDLYENDWFQFVTDTSWNYQRGWGYVSTGTLDGTEYLASGGGIDTDTVAKKQNIVCKVEGNYTFTLTTHPADDMGKPTEVSASDAITWTYNGEVQSEIEAEERYYIKGNLITAWHNMYNDATQLTETTSGVYSLSVYLKEGDQFMFYNTLTTPEETKEGGTYINASNLDEASKSYVSGTTGNITANATGTYTFTLTTATETSPATLTVAFDASVVPQAADYYIDGTFVAGQEWSGYTFNSEYQLTDPDGDGVYEITGVTLPVDSQLIIQSYKAGSTSAGEWGTDSYTGLGTYGYKYYYGSTSIVEPAEPSVGNYNFKVLEAGTYNITFDSYSKIVTIEDANAVYDIYLSGSVAAQTGWNPNFEAQFKFTQSDSDKDIYELTYTFAVDEQFGLRIYPEGANDASANYTWVGVAAGATDEVTATFTSANANNFQCTVAGTYKLSYNMSTGVLTISSVS